MRKERLVQFLNVRLDDIGVVHKIMIEWRNYFFTNFYSSFEVFIDILLHRASIKIDLANIAQEHRLQVLEYKSIV